MWWLTWPSRACRRPFVCSHPPPLLPEQKHKSIPQEEEQDMKATMKKHEGANTSQGSVKARIRAIEQGRGNIEWLEVD